MDSMFLDAWKFDHDLSMWDVSSVTTIDSMFRRAGVFNQDLSVWCFDESVDHDDYDTLAVSWSEPRPQFGDCSAAPSGGHRGRDTTTTTVPGTTVPGDQSSPPPTTVATDNLLPRTGSDLTMLWSTAVALSAGFLLLLGRRRLRG